MQIETCHHVKEDGVYCGSPAQRDRKYCYYHLMQRVRRLRRARALRDDQPQRLEIPPLDDAYAIRIALTGVAQAIASGQLEALAAGKLLYAIQLAAAANRRIEKMEAEAAQPGLSTGNASRVQDAPELEAQLGLPAGADLDAEIAAAERQAEEARSLRHADALPEPPAGLRVGSPAWHIYRDETYKMLRYQISALRYQLRDYHEEKRQQLEQLKKEMMSAAPPPRPAADSA